MFSKPEHRVFLLLLLFFIPMKLKVLRNVKLDGRKSRDCDKHHYKESQLLKLPVYTFIHINSGCHSFGLCQKNICNIIPFSVSSHVSAQAWLDFNGKRQL